jgi:hypothetical protein
MHTAGPAVRHPCNKNVAAASAATAIHSGSRAPYTELPIITRTKECAGRHHQTPTREPLEHAVILKALPKIRDRPAARLGHQIPRHHGKRQGGQRRGLNPDCGPHRIHRLKLLLLLLLSLYHGLLLAEEAPQLLVAMPHGARSRQAHHLPHTNMDGELGGRRRLFHEPQVAELKLWRHASVQQLRAHGCGHRALPADVMPCSGPVTAGALLVAAAKSVQAEPPPCLLVGVLPAQAPDRPQQAALQLGGQAEGGGISRARCYGPSGADKGCMAGMHISPYPGDSLDQHVGSSNGETGEEERLVIHQPPQARKNVAEGGVKAGHRCGRQALLPPQLHVVVSKGSGCYPR